MLHYNFLKVSMNKVQYNITSFKNRTQVKYFNSIRVNKEFI